MNEKTIDRYLSEAYAALATAQTIADEEGISFRFEPAYGMGGTYYPPQKVKEWDYLRYEYGLDPENGGWISSSQTC